MRPTVQTPEVRISRNGKVVLNEKDSGHLRAEAFDAKLLAEFKSFKGAIGEFINQLSSSKANSQGEMESMVFKHNVRSRSINGYIKEFDANEALRVHVRENNVKAYHTVISFSKLDTEHLRHDVLKDIAQQYMALRGENSLYVGAVHRDKEHIHIHLVMSGVQYLTGKANRISRQQFQELKIAMQEYQRTKYPQLKNSLPEHDKAKHSIVKEIAPEKNINAERTSDKSSLLGLLETTYSNSNSVEHFLGQVSLLGHTPYYRNGRLQGIKYNNERKFRLKPLGYDTEKLEELNRRTQQQENELRDIADLRNRGYTRDISKSNDPTQTLASSLTDLEELAALRGHTAKNIEQGNSERERADDLESDAQDRDNDFDDKDTDTDDSSKENDNPQDEENDTSESDAVQSEHDINDTEQIE